MADDCYAECCYAECCYAECCYAECCYAECCYAVCRDAECLCTIEIWNRNDVTNKSIENNNFKVFKNKNGHHDTHHNDTHRVGLISDIQHNDPQPNGITTHGHYPECRCDGCCFLFIVMLNVIMLSVIMLSVVMLSVVMLSVIMLNVVVLNVNTLSVVAPKNGPAFILITFISLL